MDFWGVLTSARSRLAVPGGHCLSNARGQALTFGPDFMLTSNDPTSPCDCQCRVTLTALLRPIGPNNAVRSLLGPCAPSRHMQCLPRFPLVGSSNLGPDLWRLGRPQDQQVDRVCPVCPRPCRPHAIRNEHESINTKRPGFTAVLTAASSVTTAEPVTALLAGSPA